MTTLFLSYARGDDEPFVRRLHADLTAYGFVVWFDRVSMPARNLTFHQEIRDAVAACDRLVLVIGPKAIASQYVRQEWQFAWFEAERIVTPILRQGAYPIAIPELTLIHCEDFRDDAQYQEHLQKLVRQLADPPPRLGKLIGVPGLPAHYLARGDRLIPLRDAVRSGLDTPAPFGGMAARQRFHGIGGVSKHVGMHGMGGIGKTVLASLLVHDRQIREAFPDGIIWVGLGSVPVVADLMRRVHRDLGGDGAFETEHEGKTKLKEALADKAVLLVLDDAWRRPDVDAFDILGPRCRALLTTRDAGLLSSLGGTHHLVELLTGDEALRLLALAVGKELHELPAEAAALLKQCGRLSLAVSLAGGMVTTGMSWTNLLSAFDRHKLEFFEDEHRPEQHQSLWKVIEISVQALPAAEQMRLVELGVFPEDEAVPEAAVVTLWSHTGQLDDLDTARLLARLKQRSLVQLTESEPGGTAMNGVSLHDLIHDYCLRRAQKEFGNPAILHERLLEAYRQQAPGGWWTCPDDGYFLTHLREHLAEAGRGEELADLLHELLWLETKSAAGLVFDLPRDFAAALATVAPSDHRHRRFSLLDETLRRDLNFIARHAQDYPQGLFQCLWNTGWWYDAPEAAAYYDLTKRTGTGPLPWELPPEQRLSTLLEGWRAVKERRHPGFLWVRSQRPPQVHLATAQRAVLRGHEGAVMSVAWSGDGRRLASGSRDNTMRVWDVSSGQELLCLRGHKILVASVSWSGDGCRLASGSDDGAVWVWDLSCGQELLCLRGHDNAVTSVAWSGDSRRLVSGSSDKTVRVWDASSGQELLCLRGHENPVASVSWSGDGRRLASGSDDGTVRVWDASSGQEFLCLRGHEKAVTSVAWSGDGHRLASGSADATVRVWDASSGQELLCFRGHEAEDDTARVWDASSDEEFIVCLSGHEGFRVNSVAWSGDGDRLDSCSDDGTVRVWDASSGQELLCLHGQSCVTSVAWSGDGHRLVSRSWDGTVWVGDASSGQEFLCLRGHERAVTSVAWSGDGRRIVSGSEDKTLRVWDPSGRQELLCVHGHEDAVRSLAWSGDGCRLVTGSQDQTVRVWDASSGQELFCLRGHEKPVDSVAWSGDGRRLVSGSFDETMRVWDASSGQELFCVRGHENRITSVAWNRDGRRLVSGSDDGTMQVWDASSGQELFCLRGHENRITSVAWSGDGRRLVSGSDDGTVRVWDASSGQELFCLRGHENGMTSLAWSGDGHRLVSGCWDGTVRVWDAWGGQELLCLHGHKCKVTNVAWSDDGRRLVSGSDRLIRFDTVRVWDASSGECLQVYRGRGDIHAIALGTQKFPFIALEQTLETAI